MPLLEWTLTPSWFDGLYYSIGDTWRALDCQIREMTVDDSDQRQVNEWKFGNTGKYIKKAIRNRGRNYAFQS